MALAAGAACAPPASPARERSVFYASGADLQSINPLLTVHPLAKAVQKHLLFITLATYDSALVPIPRLATWQWDDARTVLTFALREDVRWHDGRPVTAGDVVWTLAMAREPDVGYPRSRDLKAVRAIEAPDSRTVVVRFASAQPTFPDVLTDLAMLPAHGFSGLTPAEVRAAPFNARPVGCGPFRFVEHRTNDRWVFERVETFPRDLGVPPVDRFVIAVVDEPSTKLAALTSGELDFAGITAAHASVVRDDPRLRVVEYPLLFVTGIFWNTRRPPFDSAPLRRALGMAIDKPALMEAAAYGFGVVAHGPVPPEHPWHAAVEAVPFDPGAAAVTLDSLGWSPGKDGVRVRAGERLAFDLLTVGSGDLVLEQMVQSQLAAVGVAARLRPLELSTFLAIGQSPARAFDALLLGVPGDLSLGYVGALFGDRGGPQDYTGFASGALDGAFQRVDAAVTEAELAQAWTAAQRDIGRGDPVTWLYHARGVQGVSARISGATPDLRGELANLVFWRVEALAR